MSTELEEWVAQALDGIPFGAVVVSARDGQNPKRAAVALDAVRAAVAKKPGLLAELGLERRSLGEFRTPDAQRWIVP